MKKNTLLTFLEVISSLCNSFWQSTVFGVALLFILGSFNIKVDNDNILEYYFGCWLLFILFDCVLIFVKSSFRDILLETKKDKK